MGNTLGQALSTSINAKLPKARYADYMLHKKSRKRKIAYEGWKESKIRKHGPNRDIRLRLDKKLDPLANVMFDTLDMTQAMVADGMPATMKTANQAFKTTLGIHKLAFDSKNKN